MEPERRELIEKFFRKARVVVMIDKSAVVEIGYRKGAFMIDVKNPVLLMGIGLDLKLLSRSKGKSVIRKAIKEMGFGLKLRYGRLEFDL
jgi:hypothetical protein